MPYLNINEVNLHYAIVGDGPETIVFSHGLLMSGHMFHAQVAAFGDRYRCVVYDHRGQGQSEVAASGYDMDTVVADAAELIRRLDCAPCHFVGLSMGGFVGLRLALRQPRLLRSLTLLDSSAEPEPEKNRPRYRRMALVGRWLGFSLVGDAVMNILFGNTFLNDPTRDAEREDWKHRLLANDRAGVTRAAKGVIERQGVAEQLSSLALPVLILVGEEDVATPPEKSRLMAGRIAGARFEVIPQAGHTSTVENPQAVNAALGHFLEELNGG